MIRKIHIENFRSIRNEDLELGKITVLTGANNSGKSSIMYGLMVLQDFVFNPNQTLEELFALPFINLGGFEEVVCKSGGLDLKHINVGITIDTNFTEVEQVDYFLSMKKGETSLNILSVNNKLEFYGKVGIGLPYTGNIEREFDIVKNDGSHVASAKWNGFQTSVSIEYPTPEANNLATILYSPIKKLMGVDFISIKRGFTKPHYNLVPLTGITNTEEEIATLLKLGDKDFVNFNKINEYLIEIADRIIELPSNGTPGLFSLKAKNTKTGQSNFLVNEGSGTNQLVTILAKTFQYNKRFTCIDEPEIHLHPSMVRKLANAFVDITTDMGEHQFLVSTHSEHFVQALLSSVAQGKIKADDVKIYHLTMTDRGTKVEAQAINDKGQIAGGLSHFYASEIEDFKSMFKLVD